MNKLHCKDCEVKSVCLIKNSHRVDYCGGNQRKCETCWFEKDSMACEFCKALKYGKPKVKE